METRQRRSFTDDYKRQAVDLVASSGRSVGSVAKELGLRDSVLRRWVEQRGAGREPTAASRRPRCIHRVQRPLQGQTQSRADP
jgi:transposase